MARQRAWPGDDPRKLGLAFVGRVGRRRVVLARHAIALGGPLAEIDQLAALAAERPPPVLRRIGREPAALRAGDLLYRLQNVSSKGTSQSAVRVRASSPFWERKRMLSTYLLALISGTHAAVGSSRRRSICALLPPCICWYMPCGAVTLCGRPDSRRM